MEKELTEKEVFERLKYILDKFILFCDKNNLHPYLCAGTLLGAVRHKGFIPWDDDIDLLLPRNEFDFLINNFEYIDKEKTLKVTPFDEENSIFLFAKITDQKTRIERESALEGEPLNLWIDIFPADNLPKNKINRKFFFLISSMYISWIGLSKTTKPKGKGLLWLSNYLGGKLFHLVGTKRILNMQIKHAKKYEKKITPYIGSVTWGLHGERETMKRTDFDKPVSITFEGSKYKTFSSYKEVLAAFYGKNYMELPPVEKRIKHNYKAFLNI